MKGTHIGIPLLYEDEKTKEVLLKRLQQLGTNLKFNDDIWFCDKVITNKGTSPKENKIYFTPINQKYKELLKWYVLERKQKNQVSTLVRKVSKICYFLKYLEEQCNLLDLEKVNGKVINHFEIYIKNSSLKKGYTEGIWSETRDFFKFLTDWDIDVHKVPFGRYNPFGRKKKDFKVQEKYIPEYVCDQLDVIFQDESIPLHIRLSYWLMRAIPSRVSEITGMTLECLKPSYDDKMVLFTPTTKQEGDIGTPVIRAIYLNPKGDFEKFLINLIKKQQEYVKGLKDNILVKEKIENMGENYLFTIVSRYAGYNKPYIFNPVGVEGAFKKICLDKNVRDEKGKPFILTPHMLRHNAITDRLEAGFSFIEIRDMTYHKGNSMLWNSYFHPTKEKTLQKQKEVIKKSKYIDVEKPVFFRGRVLNMDRALEERILKSPRAYKINDGDENIGLCSDITGCKSKMFECLDCDYFVANADQLDYFKRQVEIWDSKVRMFKNQKQALEKAEYNLKLHKKIVERIEKQIQLYSEGIKNYE